MYQDFYRGMPYAWLPIFAMLLFFAVFCASLFAAVFRCGDERRLAAKAGLPLVEDDRRAS